MSTSGMIASESFTSLNSNSEDTHSTTTEYVTQVITSTQLVTITLSTSLTMPVTTVSVTTDGNGKLVTSTVVTTTQFPVSNGTSVQTSTRLITKIIASKITGTIGGNTPTDTAASRSIGSIIPVEGGEDLYSEYASILLSQITTDYTGRDGNLTPLTLTPSVVALVTDTVTFKVTVTECPGNYNSNGELLMTTTGTTELVQNGTTYTFDLASGIPLSQLTTTSTSNTDATGTATDATPVATGTAPVSTDADASATTGSGQTGDITQTTGDASSSGNITNVDNFQQSSGAARSGTANMKLLTAAVVIFFML